MRRILHVITSLGVGGAERVLTLLCTSKGGWGEQITVVSLLKGGLYAQILRDAGVTVVELDFRSPVGIVTDFFRLISTIRIFQPAIVQGWMYHGDLFAYLALAFSGRRHRTKLIWSIRCADLDLSKYGRGLRIVVKLCALLSTKPDLVTVNSAAGMQAHRGLGYRPRHEQMVYNGFDVARFKPDAHARTRVRAEFGIPADAVVIAHVARVDPAKDHPSFLQAMQMMPEIMAILVGLDTDKLPAAPNILRLGVRSDVQSILPAADLIVASSLSEGFPNVIAEGMACGLVPIATDVGDTRAIVEQAGWLLPPRDPEAIARAARSYAAMLPSERAAMSQRARTRIETHFTLPGMIAAYSAIYGRLVADAAPAPASTGEMSSDAP